MLPLDDPRWNELRDAYGPASKIPNLLRQLKSNTKPVANWQSEPWFSLWSALCHQGDVYSASYAAVPHIIQIGHDATGEIDKSFFILPHEIVVTKLRGKGPEIPDYVRPGFFGLLPHLRKIKLSFNEELAIKDDTTKTMYTKDGLCKQCGHKSDPHLIISLNDERTQGIGLCPEEGCTCFITWELGPQASQPEKL